MSASIEVIDESTLVEPPEAFLEVRDLKVHFPTEDGLVKAVDGLTFKVAKGDTLGIVGESGSGKSVTSLAILGIHKGSRARVSGEIWLDGQELVAMREEEIRSLRGPKMAMVFQDPLSSLHPFYKIGDQIVEAYREHHPKASKAEARSLTIDMLDRVGIPNPKTRVDDYPHQFSGGMRQRAMIAMALINTPELIIADEPTTALDVTVQAQILELMKDLQGEFHTAIIIITHDLGVVAETAERVIVMYAGRKVEEAAVGELFARPLHPYTRGLMNSIPRLALMRREAGPAVERLQEIPGMVPALSNLPQGCIFAPRCAFADDRCRAQYPAYEQKRPQHWAACWHSDKLAGAVNG
jgi:peptide/nickel transport system ATP-binding protein